MRTLTTPAASVNPVTDFAALMPDMARRLLGEPDRIQHGGATWRYGNKGSLVVHVAGDHAGTWHDFEAEAGGGTLDLVRHKLGCDKAGALAWLEAERLIAPKSDAAARTAERRRPAGTRIPPNVARRADGATEPPRSKTAHLVRPILQRSVAADGTPASRYLAERGTWPASAGALPEAVRWISRAGLDSVLRRNPLPAAAAGALVYALTRPGAPPDSVEMEPVTADGRRLQWPEIESTKRAYGLKREHMFEVAAATGDPWPNANADPLAVAVVEGAADALAIARLRLPGVLVRAACTTPSAGLVADLPLHVAVCLVADADDGGRDKAVSMHLALDAAGRRCYPVIRAGGRDPDDLLRGVADADLAERHNERAGILLRDSGLDRPAATALALTRLLEGLSPGGRT